MYANVAKNFISLWEKTKYPMETTQILSWSKRKDFVLTPSLPTKEISKSYPTKIYKY